MANILSPDIDTCEICNSDKHVEYSTISEIYRIMICMRCSNRITKAMIQDGLQSKISCIDSQTRAIENGVDATITRINADLEDLYRVRNLYQSQMMEWIEHWLKYQSQF